MTKIKYLILFCAVLGVAACKKDVSYDEEAQFAADTAAIRAFISANNIPAVAQGNSGVYYQIYDVGSGNVTYSGDTQVTVEYEGRLLNGQVFDNSNGTPRMFTLGGLIPGWQIGIPLIQPGGRIRLIVPSYLGYGFQDKNGIPANSILDFTIELKAAQ
ncbi:FKBP-type peptidyl-prolyl cis-trans isomerase [Pedobacter metabolipauper]|uniref:Peptidyl-prolyl cis-trans isomerase n=1 Tax=Pedobacter metabolipauper TaxID=425513 RepID=A0A4R6SPM8_9SPHI|nr:FKBP-type peptidyl-prolyl cis-trans isomerase [Pedobacter metabolipauper]TDQ06569.1 FKBP-type peptidyl-prolyl cis-trans isomerase FkpA [Pedobacter metabolipauper]